LQYCGTEVDSPLMIFGPTLNPLDNWQMLTKARVN